jgi:hypothetical protein
MSRLVCLAAVLVALSPAAAHAASPVSSHSMIHTSSTPYALKQRAFSESQALGASFIRVDVELGPIFESFGHPRSQPDWSGLDEIVQLSHEYHLPVLGIVLGTPGYVSDCPERWPDSGRCGAADAGEYGRLAGELAAHSRGAIAHWEIVNEPDGRWAFEGSAEQYARMLSASYDAIKARAPEDQVVLGGVMSPTDPRWIERVFATPGADAAHKFDIANMHLRGRLVDLPTGVAAWRGTLAHHGFNGPLWVTEHGYSADPAFQQDPGFTGGEPSQAGYLKRSLLTLTESGVQQVFVTLRDNSDLEPNYVHEGLERIGDGPGYDVQRKPAFAAVQDFSRRWPEIHALLLSQRAHERRALELSLTALADETRLQHARTGRADVLSSLNATRRVISRAKTARSSKRARARLRAAKRLAPKLQRVLKRYEVRVRAYAQRAAGERLEAHQHVLAALDCARRIAG